MTPDFAILGGEPDDAAAYLREFLAGHGVDADTRFMFVSNSADRPPGFGSQEALATGRERDFEPLTAIGNWRRKLSNFWRAPFRLVIPGVTADEWETVEHYFQAYKLSLADPAVAETLSLAASPIDRNVAAEVAGLAARKQRKAILLDEATLTDWDHRKWSVMEAALHAKFTAHDDLRAVLLATRDAHLIHVPARAPRHGGTDRRGRFVDHTQWPLLTVRASISV